MLSCSENCTQVKEAIFLHTQPVPMSPCSLLLVLLLNPLPVKGSRGENSSGFKTVPSSNVNHSLKLGWAVCVAGLRLTEGKWGRETARRSFFSPLNSINYPGWSCLGKEGGEGKEAIFPIDCLIAPEAVCPRPLAKSIMSVAKVRLGRFPYPFLVLNKATHKAQPGYRNRVYVDFCHSAVP